MTTTDTAPPTLSEATLDDLHVFDGTVVDVGEDVCNVMVAGDILPMPATEWPRDVAYAVGDELLVVRVPDAASGRDIASTTRGEVVARLFTGVMEDSLLDLDVEVVKVARVAGLRSKIVVARCDGRIGPDDGRDVIGDFVGRGANRVRYVIDKLGGECVDIVAWHPDLATFVANALTPVEPTRVVLSENDTVATAYVASHEFGAAKGEGGANVGLAGQLAGLSLHVEIEPA